MERTAEEIVQTFLAGRIGSGVIHWLALREHRVHAHVASHIDASLVLDKLSARAGSNVTLILPAGNLGSFDSTELEKVARTLTGVIAHESIHVYQWETDRTNFTLQSDTQGEWVASQKAQKGDDADLWELAPDEWLQGYYRDFEIEAHGAQLAVERLLLQDEAGIGERKLKRRLREQFDTSPFGVSLNSHLQAYLSLWA